MRLRALMLLSAISCHFATMGMHGLEDVKKQEILNDLAVVYTTPTIPNLQTPRKLPGNEFNALYVGKYFIKLMSENEEANLKDGSSQTSFVEIFHIPKDRVSFILTHPNSVEHDMGKKFDHFMTVTVPSDASVYVDGRGNYTATRLEYVHRNGSRNQKELIEDLNELASEKLQYIASNGVLSHIDFNYAVISNLEIFEANLKKVSIKNAYFDNVTFVHANFCKAKLKKTYFNGGNLDYSDFSESTISNGAVFVGTSLQRVDFQKANLTGSLFMNIIFPKEENKKVNFKGAILKNVKFNNVNLAGYDFSGVDVSGADFEGSDLTGADFSGAKIRGAKFDKAITTNTKMPSGATGIFTSLINGLTNF